MDYGIIVLIKQQLQPAGDPRIIIMTLVVQIALVFVEIAFL